MRRLTAIQKNALQLAVDSGGEIQIGGLDGQPVRIDVAFRLFNRGLMSRRWNELDYECYRITDAGRAELESGDKQS